MTDSTNAYPQTSTPNPTLRTLDVLVGEWEMNGRESGSYGEIHGTIKYEWMDGGFFLLQHFDFTYVDHRVQGIEVIGYEQKWGENAPSKDIMSHVFDAEGNHFEYVYEADDTTLTIWGGSKGSPAYYKGTINADRNTIAGAWHYPGGGGYESTITRIQA